MKKLTLIITLILTVGSVSAGLVGHWNLNGNFDNDVGGGDPLALIGVTQLDYTNDTIGGSAAQELSFPAFDGYTKLINVPNEAAQTPSTNYTIVFDVKFPVIGGWTALYDMDEGSDGELFIKITVAELVLADNMMVLLIKTPGIASVLFVLMMVLILI